jgi:hypothetical protein
MPSLPEAMIVRLAPFAPLFSERGGLHAQGVVVGAILAPGTRTGTRCLRGRGWAGECPFPSYPRVLHRARGSAVPAGKLLLGGLVLRRVPPGAALVLGAADTGERRSGRKRKAQGCSREAVRSPQNPGMRGCGRNGGARRVLGPVPWARRGGRCRF